MNNLKEYENTDKINELLNECNKALDALIECKRIKIQSNVNNIEQLHVCMDIHIGIHMNTLQYIHKEIIKIQTK